MALQYDGYLVFDSSIDTKGFKQDADKMKSMADRVVKTIGLTISAGAIARGLVSIGKAGVEAASDLEEVQNVVDVTFGDSAAQVNSWAKAAKNSYGLSEKAAKQYTGTMGAMLKSMGLADDKVLQMSTSLTGLAADFASFYNLASEEAFEKIRAGISGETEPLKQLGINMSVANLEAYALSQGIDKSYNSMTQAEQALLRYNYLLSVSADAQGDFARTSDSYANASRITAMNIDRVSTGIGSELLPTVTKATIAIGDMAGELADAVDTGGIEGGINYIQTEFPLATAVVKSLAVSFGTLSIAKKITPMIQSFQHAQIQLSLASMQGSLATMAETGALTGKEVIVGVLTGKIKLATAAQAAYNAVLRANPVTLVATALGALVGAVSLADRVIVKANDTLRENEESALSLKHSIDELSTSIDSSAESYEKTASGIESNLAAADGLISKLDEMSSAYTGTNAEQEIMSSLCDKLNGSVEGLNVSFDRQTGKLNMTADAMRAYAKASSDTAVREAAVKRYTELLVEQKEAEYQLKVAEEKRSDLSKNSESYSIKAAGSIGKAYKSAKDSLEQVNKELEYQEGYLADLGETLPETTESMEGYDESLQKTAEDEERVVIAGYDVTDVLEKAGLSADEASKRFEDYSEAAQNMFDVINTESEYSVEQMISNLNANKEAIAAYGENLRTLAGQLPEDLYNALAGNPEKFAGVVSELAAAKPEDLAALKESWTAAGDEAAQAWLNSMGAVEANSEELPTAKLAAAMGADHSMEDAAKEAVTKTEVAMRNQVVISNFPLIGQQVANGITQGLYTGSGPLYAAGRQIVQNLLAQMMAAAQIHSPSKITDGYGQNLMMGWGVGMKKKLGFVLGTARESVKALVSEFASVGYPNTYSGVKETAWADSGLKAGNTTNVIQNIYAQEQSPAALMREAMWKAERAVLVGV